MMATYKSDIEIAQETKMLPIAQVAEAAGVDEKYLEQYGKYKAKVDYNLLKEVQRPDGKLILVTAITPTPFGEGKSTVSLGLIEGLGKLGKSLAISGTSCNFHGYASSSSFRIAVSSATPWAYCSSLGALPCQPALFSM